MNSIDLLNFNRIGSVCVVTITARELTSSLAEELSTRLLSFLNDDQCTRFVIDFSQVQYMESACLGSLVQFLKWLARSDGRMAVAQVQENVRFLFRVTKLDKVFPLCADVPAAIRMVEKP